MEKSIVADNVRMIVDCNGYRHSAIAERAGYTRQQFSDMLNGRKLITADDVIKLKEALGCSYNEIFYGPEPAT